MKRARQQVKQADPARLPFVLMNMSMSADGKIATWNREVSTFSSKRDHEHLLELRSTVDAVMCGARTVDLNEINLGPGGVKWRRKRRRAGLDEFNLRILVTGSGSLDAQAEVFRHRFSPILILTTERITARALETLQQVADEVRICGRREIDWSESLAWLRREHQVNRLMIEGGGELNDALFRAGLVDELHLTICPVLLGGRNAPTIADGVGVGSLEECFGMKLVRRKLVNNEVFAVFKRA